MVLPFQNAPFSVKVSNPRDTVFTLYFLSQNPEQSQSPARLEPRGSGSLRQEEDHGQTQQQPGRLRQVRGELSTFLDSYPNKFNHDQFCFRRDKEEGEYLVNDEEMSPTV